MLKIRPAQLDELDDVFDIVRKAITYMDNLRIFQWDKFYPTREILQSDIEQDQMQLIEDEGSIAGFITLTDKQPQEYQTVDWSYSGRVMVVHRLTVDPARQRKGFATQLMDYAEKRALADGYNTIRLDVFTQNPAAKALYVSRGYRKSGTVRFRERVFFCYEKQIIQ